LEEEFVICYTLRSSYHFAISLGSEEVATFGCTWVLGIFWHIKCLDL
jgi:hypothetical protein